MFPNAPIALRTRALLDFAQDEDMRSPASRVHHIHSMAPARVPLQPMLAGSVFLSRWPVQEGPGVISWRETEYECMAPAVFVLRDALVHSSAGIIGIGGAVIAETLAHTEPHAQKYGALEQGIALQPRRLRRLSGTHLTILAGGSSNYFHSMIESLARLAMLPEAVLAQAQSVLVPRDAAAQAALLPLLGLPEKLAWAEIADDDTLLVERLIFPWTVHGLASFHPCVNAFFDALAARVPEAGGELPKRFYIDRSGAWLRRLDNEDEVVSRLRGLGFTAVRPERLPLTEQIRLFRGAEAIVAPHGAGLTNIGFCRPGCCVLELHMDAYVTWIFRRLAGLRRLSYDCVIGRAAGAWPANDSPDIHALRWQVSAQHVAAAARQMLAGLGE